MSKLTTEEFVMKSRLCHGLKYNYDKAFYINARTKICITCKEHGDFEQLPHNHLRGNVCPKCANIEKSIRNKLTQKQWIGKANQVHNFKYDYSKVKYKDSRSKVIIICKKHGEWLQLANAHLQGNGCSKCNFENLPQNQALTTELFIEKAKKIHGNKYNYSFVKYKDWITKIEIMCNKHGVFEQQAGSHLQGTGCPSCSLSKGENAIDIFLTKNNFNYAVQYKFNNCRNINVLPFDFFIYKTNTCIEFDGIQHYESIEYFGGEENFQKVKTSDQIKNQFCEDNNIRLIRIPYWDFDNIEQILVKELIKVKGDK